MPKTFGPRALTTGMFIIAALLSLIFAGGASTLIQQRTERAVRLALATAGQEWVEVKTSGLEVRLSGVAPRESNRFRALTVTGSVIDSNRVVDLIEVADPTKIAVPEFSVEMLRNDEGVSLIGLLPAAPTKEEVLAPIQQLSAIGQVTDLLDSTTYEAPETWASALTFGTEALKTLPRAKISVTASRVSVTAITDSPEERARVEAALSRKVPKGVRLVLDISAPRPVITPFTTRFVVDGQGARFDACSADSESARRAILAAAKDSGVPEGADCEIGLGVPSPDWSRAVAAGVRAMAALKAGSITFSDADVALVAADSVSQADFDRVVGELDTALPEVFSLKAELTPKPEATGQAGPPEFSATLSPEGRVDLRGRLLDEPQRLAVENLARARFGVDQVFPATRLDDQLPDGWPVRVLAALDALDLLEQGNALVQPDKLSVSGVTGDARGRDKIAQLLAARLGPQARLDLAVTYDKKLDASLGLPTGPECAERLNAVLAEHKIAFEPGKDVLAEGAGGVIDKLAKQMQQCSDFALEVGGHTDSQGGEEMNLKLSQARAEAVIAALRERRVLTGNLTAKGFGETQPKGDNATEAGRETNRRIEFVLLGGDSVTLARDPAPADAAAEAPVAAKPGEEALVVPVYDAAEGRKDPLPRPAVVTQLAAEAAPALPQGVVPAEGGATPPPVVTETAPPAAPAAAPLPDPPLPPLDPATDTGSGD